MNLPNALTLSRIFLVPLLLAAMLSGRFTLSFGLFSLNEEELALLIFLAASATDGLDGYIARRRRQVTQLGKLLDPIADKLLISAAFISLVELGRVDAWIVVLIVGREFAVSGLRYVALTQGITISASWLGKAKMWSQVVAVSLLLIRPNDPVLGQLAYLALTAVVILTVVSMYDYFRAFFQPQGAPRPLASRKSSPSASKV
ncbi:MAG: CDP-diacylglycerol--glycerol-3-phosphate 3-phosphatidyltransferase [Acidobacteria bacterium]|nr:CDP-diacylglycerol--glycerol-3-phosphate 3-phosphatidyltransferase [Acidobacteriota bacterium]